MSTKLNLRMTLWTISMIFFLYQRFKVVGRRFYYFICWDVKEEQDLGTVFMCCSLGFTFKILSCGFFFHGMEVYFLVK